ncbi:unnamed protein product [Camellia sinensis]
MSDKCGNLDCADKSQCVKKNTIDIVETDKSYIVSEVMDAPAAEHDGKCKSDSNCACVNCTCGH